jgi:hypothetical protein
MTKIPGCLIDANFARVLLTLARERDPTIPKEDLSFICPGCGHPVAPYKDHFQHLKEKPECPLTPK